MSKSAVAEGGTAETWWKQLGEDVPEGPRFWLSITDAHHFSDTLTTAILRTRKNCFCNFRNPLVTT